jgi:hypothetical protein
MHLTYRMETAGFVPIIESIARLKSAMKRLGIESTGLPLFVHPVFDVSSSDEIRALATDVHTLVKSFATESNLKDIEFLATGGIAEHDIPNAFVWTWSTFIVDQVNGKPVPRLHPIGRGVQENKARGDDSIERNYQSVVMDTVGVFPDIKESFRQASLFDEIKLWRGAVKENLGLGATGIRKVSKQVLEKSISIDDPTKYNIRMMDCVSCHASTMLRMQAVESSEDPKYFGGYFRKLSHLPTYLTMKPAYQNDGENRYPYVHAEYNYHMFSYWLQHPSVAQRTINESIMVADYINRNYAAVLAKVYGLEARN